MIDYHIHSEFSDGDQTISEIISVAKRRKLESIAITDHIDSNGVFMYLRDTRPPKSFKEYVNTIRYYSKKTNYKIYVGIEISDFTPPETPLNPEFSLVDLILIETQKPRGPTDENFDPIKKALFIKKQFGEIPVGLAHPTIEFIEKNIEKFEKYDIFIELNGDKLSRTYNKLDDCLKTISQLLNEHKKVKLSIGSDAHQIYMIGSVNNIWNFIVKNNFVERLILYP